MKTYEKVALEIWTLYHEFSGAISSISGRLKRNNSSKLSRQISPNDDQRDNFYIELLEVHSRMVIDNPELESQIWHVLERERAEFRAGHPTLRMKTGERINKVYEELGDVIKKHNTNAPKDELIKEAYDLIPAVNELYENIVQKSEMEQ